VAAARSAPPAHASVQTTAYEGPLPAGARTQIERVDRTVLLRGPQAYDLRWARWQLLDAATLSDPRSAAWTLGGPGGVDPLTGTWDPSRGFGDGALSGAAGGSAILGAFGAMATSGWACVERLANGRAIRRHFLRTFMRRGAVMLSWRVDF
jgi:hypothetical protein